ncbi:hypothetical protein CAEBREN_17494 [Caenorhabditis brenneri]|uniref:DDE Tnp4 domain-containing protein n=1 Tax=Caenorhabditis brenneri TaxID=135651 RepID=G0MZP4_CAEBE|nr:hypothetical protein CAEBREN_17494 [Caenorhabditis brenneri]
MDTHDPQATSEKKQKVQKILPLLQHHQALMAITLHAFSSAVSPSSAISITKSASFNIFKQKIEYLVRNEEIEHFYGVTMRSFNEILPLVTHNEKCHYTKEVRLCIFLQYVKEGLTQNAVSRTIGLSQASISRIVNGIIKDLVNVASNYIKFPQTREEIYAATKGFYEKEDSKGRKRRMPCFGILDGKHWKTEHPPHSGSLNYNYKCFFSFNSLFVTDFEHRIIYLQISENGVNNDAQLLAAGPLKEMLKNAAEVGGCTLMPDSTYAFSPFILADNGFGLDKTVMLPYRQEKLDKVNIKFNEKVSATRVKIENLFGVLTSKFQCFDRNLKLPPTAARGLIVALSVIHNISKGPMRSIPVPNLSVMEDPYRSAEEMRTALKNFLLNL